MSRIRALAEYLKIGEGNLFLMIATNKKAIFFIGGRFFPVE
jgi:hypothetical protein